MADLLQTLIVSLVLGSLYALIALGYTMVFGVLKLINFAHSDVVVLGAWISLVAATLLLPQMGVYLPDAPWWSTIFVLIVAMTTCGIIGFCIERFAYRPIRKAPRLNALITAIGVSLLLQNTGQLQFDLIKSKTESVTVGHVAQRVESKKLKLDTPLTLDAAGTYAMRFKDPTSADTLDRPLPLKPGTYPAGTIVDLDPGVPGRYATAEFSLMRTSMPLKLPFGARPASLPKGILPADSSDLSPEQRAKTFLWRPSPAVVAQLNLYSDVKTANADGTRDRIYKPVRFTVVDALIIGTAILLMLGLQYLVFGTRVGTAMRAVSYNMDTAALMGIPVDRIVSITFVTGTMLAAAAGFLYALRYAPIQQPAHASWTLLGLKAFVAAVVGGIGNIRGAAVGGFLIAIIEQFSAYGGSVMHWDRISSLTDVIVFALLIVVLLVKPTGLFGSPIREKV